MAAATRDFAITYGALTVGTGSDPDMPIHGKLSMNKSHGEFQVSFAFYVFGTGPSDFATNCATAEDAFRKPYQDLTITVGDGSTNDTWYTFSNSGGTGFDAEPSIEKSGDSEADGPKSRLYSVEILVQLPADRLGETSGQYGRRESSVSVTRLPTGRREVSISGVYTATNAGAGTGKQTGREQFEARIDAYATAVLTAIDTNAVWELDSQPLAEIDDTDPASIGLGKVCRFERGYAELIFDQAGHVDVNDPDIIRQRFTATRDRFNRDNVEHLSTQAWFDRANVNYECFIRTGTSTDRYTGAKLVTKYDETIRPWIYQQARTLLNIQTTHIMEEHVNYNFDENSLSASMVIGGIIPGPGTIATVDITDGYSDTGREVLHFHRGDPHAGVAFQGPATYERTIRVLEHVLTMSTDNPIGRNGFTNPPNGVVKSRTVRHSPMQIQLNFDANDPRYTRGIRETTVVIEFFSSPGDTGGTIGRDLNELDGALDPSGGQGAIGLG